MMPGVYEWCITSLSSKVNQRILPSANADIFDHEQDSELVELGRRRSMAFAEQIRIVLLY